jgi:hypothetical protein
MATECLISNIFPKLLVPGLDLGINLPPTLTIAAVLLSEHVNSRGSSGSFEGL